MSVGGELYIVCNGEELLGDEFRCAKHDTSCELTMTGQVDVGFYPTAADAQIAAWSTARGQGWGLVTQNGSDRHLCASCWKTWIRVNGPWMEFVEVKHHDPEVGLVHRALSGPFVFELRREGRSWVALCRRDMVLYQGVENWRTGPFEDLDHARAACEYGVVGGFERMGWHKA